MLLFIFLLMCGSAVAQVNPLLTPSKESEKKTPETGADNPGRWYRNTEVYKSIIALQKRIQGRISELITAASGEKLRGTLALLLLGSFSYGFIHALGPGHRKVVLSSYIIGEKTSYRTAALTAFLIALVHAGSAVALIFGLYALVSGPIMGRFTEFTLDITRVSYFLLVMIGLLLIGMSVFGKKKEKDLSAHGVVRKGNRLLFIIATGAVPCPGAAAVLVFAIANNTPWLGVTAAFAMSIGMAALLIVVVTVTVFLKTNILRERPKAKGRSAAATIEKVLEITGGAIIAVFGLLMLLPV